MRRVDPPPPPFPLASAMLVLRSSDFCEPCLIMALRGVDGCGLGLCGACSEDADAECESARESDGDRDEVDDAESGGDMPLGLIPAPAPPTRGDAPSALPIEPLRRAACGLSRLELSPPARPPVVCTRSSAGRLEEEDDGDDAAVLETKVIDGGASMGMGCSMGSGANAGSGPAPAPPARLPPLPPAIITTLPRRPLLMAPSVGAMLARRPLRVSPMPPLPPLPPTMMLPRLSPTMLPRRSATMLPRRPALMGLIASALPKISPASAPPLSGSAPASPPFEFEYCRLSRSMRCAFSA